MTAGEESETVDLLATLQRSINRHKARRGQAQAAQEPRSTPPEGEGTRETAQGTRRLIPSTRSKRGAMSELIAAVHFMDDGWDVFRSESPACPFDLVIHKAGVLYRVEVKSATIKTEGYTPAFALPRNDQWDRLAIVHPDHRVLVLEPMSGPELRAAFRQWLGVPPITPMVRGAARYAALRGSR